MRLLSYLLLAFCIGSSCAFTPGKILETHRRKTRHHPPGIYWKTSMMTKQKVDTCTRIICSGKEDDEEQTFRFLSSRREYFVATTTALLFPWPAMAEDADTSVVTVHKLNYPVAGKCGQANVPASVVGLVKTFGGFQDGTCATEGFSEPQGTSFGTGDKDQQRTYSIYAKL